MALIEHRTITEDTSLALWRIEEDEQFFLDRLQLTEEDQRMIDSIKAHRRLLEWLASRYLVRYLLNPDHEIHLAYEDNNRPKLLNLPYHISISHSGDVAAVMISKSMRVAIDVECIHPKVLRVADKFMSEEEMAGISEEHKVEELILHWSAKETLFKYHGDGGLEFRDQLHLTNIQPQKKGEALGAINTEVHYQLPVYYELIGDDFVITYCYS